MSDTRYHKMAQVRALRTRRKHFDYAADSVYEGTRLRESDTETRIRNRAWMYVLAWQGCTDAIYRIQGIASPMEDAS